MSYTALYRKFRPGRFADVRGQDHIVKTLRNQIMAERIGHAYLFCGTRGTGKTTVAKILAKAVNCESPDDGEPCNQCAVCRAIASGSSMNVIEIDAASNNGVDDIRQIREEVKYSPAEGRYKVYIVDEVHMLSTNAFNALLKTLEEPPSYVIFILATTDPQKIPATILSRCQRYDFRRIGQKTISDQLCELTKIEHVDAEERALRYIARKADGSLRDALSLLDQCISFYLGETLTYNKVLEVLGAVDTEVFSVLLRQIIKGDLVNVIRTLETLTMQGCELTQFVSDFTWYMRNLMLIKASDDMEDVLDVSSENLNQLREEASMVRQDTLMRYIRVFSELSSSIRFAANRRVQVEIALIKLCHPESERDEISLLERIRRLERLAEQGAFAGGPGAYPGGIPGAQGANAWIPGAPGFCPGGASGAQGRNGAPEQAPGTVVSGGAAGTQGVPGTYPGGAAGPGAAGDPGRMAGGQPGLYYGAGMPGAPYQRMAPEILQQIRAAWKQIIARTNGWFRVVLSASSLKFNAQDREDGRLFVVFADFLGERYLDDPEKKAELEQIIEEKTGRHVEVRFLLAADEQAQKGTLSAIELEERIHELIHTEIEIEDDED